MHPSALSRRRLLGWLAAIAAGWAASPVSRAAPRQPVMVLTSYPDEVVSRMEAAFEKAYPAYRMQVVWRMPHDALPYLTQPAQGGIDVYWSASPRTFAAARNAGAWRKLDIDRSGLPDRIGKTAIADAQGYFTASEVAGFGFAVNRRELAQRQLPLPADWTDLADPRFADQVALPIPARIGFAPPIVEIVLQAYGWDAGWALWSEISGNARLMDRGATFVSEEVATGKCAVGISIDFFVASAIANAGKDSPLDFVYPRHGGINPGQIALTADSPNREGGKAFASFVLSDAGQKILGHPDIRKLPARPGVYADLPAGVHNPFAAAARGDYDFDGLVAQPRLALSAAVFQQMLVEDHAARAALWRRVHAAQAAGKGKDAAVLAARRALGTPPLSEGAAADAALRQRFRDRLEGAERQALLTEEQAWRAHSQARQAEADAALRGIGA